MRTPSTSKPRMPAIQTLKATSTRVSTANSRQPSNQFWRCDGIMAIDGRFPRWGISEDEAGPTAEAVLDLFIEGIARR